MADFHSTHAIWTKQEKYYFYAAMILASLFVLSYIFADSLIENPGLDRLVSAL